MIGLCILMVSINLGGRVLCIAWVEQSLIALCTVGGARTGPPVGSR